MYADYKQAQDMTSQSGIGVSAITQPANNVIPPTNQSPSEQASIGMTFG